ncbi:probable coenzyme A transporter [Cephalotrichum gorgonifer]|uniref:Mitochondrial thiamine pyrophosphate carrier 1 n=1 Tax=Cephalotrichum gorgonifer TaxID=2041049 RepID=A0AAE8MQZ3_9PEZI|nr:probable coenzyme A transporter [Cephalotrichum gorgonifer]
MSIPQDGAQQNYEASIPTMKKSLSTHKPSPDDDTVAYRKHTRTFEYAWRSGVAGGLAGCAAKTLVAPLDRVKILFQAGSPAYAKYSGSWVGVAATLKDIYRNDGPTGLFRGHSATLLRIFPYAAIKFLAYEQIRSVLITHKGEETPFRRFLSGSLAGLTSVLFTYPLELIRVRMAFETKKVGRSSFVSICRQIYREQPTAKAVASLASNPANAVTDPAWRIHNFYRGFTPTLLGMLPYAGVSFLIHDTVGDLFRHPAIAKWTTLPQWKRSPKGKARPLRSWAELTAGGLAGMISQTTSYPMEIIRRRMQVGGVVGDGHRLRIGETAAMIFREKGVRGFFVGLTIGYAKVIPMVAVSFYVYERAKGVFGI